MGNIRGPGVMTGEGHESCHEATIVHSAAFKLNRRYIKKIPDEFA
jgi:hypothetical protein